MRAGTGGYQFVFPFTTISSTVTYLTVVSFEHDSHSVVQVMKMVLCSLDRSAMMDSSVEILQREPVFDAGFRSA